MKQEEARVLDDLELEKVNGGMVCDNESVLNEICQVCGQPVLRCTCHTFSDGISRSGMM